MADIGYCRQLFESPGAHELSDAGKNFFCAAVHGFRQPADAWFHPFPDLLGRIIFRGIGRECKNYNVLIIFDKISEVSAEVNGSIVGYDDNSFTRTMRD